MNFNDTVSNQVLWHTFSYYTAYKITIRCIFYYTLYNFVFFFLVALHPLAAYREYRLAANIPTSKVSYPFGILQCKALEQTNWLPGLYGYLDFDTEALYLESGFAPLGKQQLLRLGARTKGHAFDWQNLNHTTDETTGREQKQQALKASYLGGDVFAAAAYSAWLARLGVGAESSRLTPLESRSGLPSSSLTWNYFYTLSGYYQHYPYLPDFWLGDSLLFSYTAYNWLSGTSPYAPREQAKSFQQATLTYKVAFFIPGALVKFEQRLAAASFAAAGQRPNTIRAWSMGGPEIAYGRLAGFAFSEYRVPAFSLTNVDVLLPVAANWYLWLVNDLFIGERKFANQQIHWGSGIGLYYLLLRQQVAQERAPWAVFVRFDRAHSASRETPLDRWQLFFGISGFSL